LGIGGDPGDCSDNIQSVRAVNSAIGFLSPARLTRTMHYLKLRRSRIILACFAASSLLLTALPRIDLYVSGIFFDDSFRLARQWWTKLMHASMGYLLCLSMAAVFGLYLFNKARKRNVCGVDGKRVVFLLLVLILGGGLIVNGLLKDNLGRARPRDIVEFGGSKLYTPPFVLSRECDRNCSFSSGEAAGGFFALALAMALSRRRRVFVSAIGFGAFVSFCRVASGAHFFSDTVVSFFVMLIVADVLYYYLLSTQIEPDTPGASEVATVRPLGITTRDAGNTPEVYGTPRL
jgi:lipid A 4'-phosphatase